jgi:putative PIN family toxin of toxin-antitoxin system
VSERQRVVIDTSTLVSAVLRPNSVPRQVFLAVVKRFDLCVSQGTLQELREVMQRPKFDRYLPVQERLEFCDLVADHACHWVVSAPSEQTAHGVCRDAKDAKFLALSLDCQAVTLVTSDADLLVLHPWHGISVLAPTAFLATLSRH